MVEYFCGSWQLESVRRGLAIGVTTAALLACSSGSSGADSRGVTAGGTGDGGADIGGLGGVAGDAGAAVGGWGGLSAVRAAYQSAIDAPTHADGSYDYTTVGVGAAYPSPSPSGFGIAVIDQGAYLSSLTIYRNRVLGHYTLAGDHFEAVEPTLSIPSPAATLMATTLAAQQEYASSTDTADLANSFALKYNRLFPSEYTHTHGDLTFNALAELNPAAYFLIFHLDGGFNTGDAGQGAGSSFEQLACSLREPQGSSNLHIFFRNLGQSVANVIADARTRGADIRFVNLSAGLDPSDVVNLTREACPEVQFTADELTDIQQADAEYLEQIAAADVVLVQSALYASADITASNWQQWYSDCEPISNRVRVGYALGPKGTQTSDRLDAQTRAGARCIDLLIGMGWADLDTPLAHAFQLSSFGTGHGSGFFWGSSIAAPLGLSVMAWYWKNGHEQDPSGTLAAAFRAGAAGLPRVEDILEDHLFLNSRDDYINNLQRH